jgi:hypothetical protein
LPLTAAAFAAPAPAATTAPGATEVVFDLVAPTKATCKDGLVILGSACADTRGLVLHEDWQPGGSSAQWNVEDRWNISYRWTVPASVPAKGAKLTIAMEATELVGRPSDRICPAMGVTSAFTFKEAAAQPAGLGFCAEAGGTKKDAKTFTLLPSRTAAPGETYTIRVGLQDGPVYVYTYRSVAAGPPKPAAGPGGKRECTTLYAVEPGGAELAANVKLVELNARERAAQRGDEDAKYDEFPYRRIGEPSRKQNCAGFVMKRLFGSKMVEANVDPDAFYRKIVRRYGSKRLGKLTARKGDVVVYRLENGRVQHVAVVESGSVTGPTILTKDGDESLFRADFPLAPLRATNDPLVTNHAARGRGSVEFWQVDTSRVSIRQVSSDC